MESLILFFLTADTDIKLQCVLAVLHKLQTNITEHFDWSISILPAAAMVLKHEKSTKRSKIYEPVHNHISPWQ